jgi:hypothetical protein
MSNAATLPPATPDPLELLARLTVADVRARLDALEVEREALLTLLRSLRARERAAARRRGDRHGWPFPAA